MNRVIINHTRNRRFIFCIYSCYHRGNMTKSKITISRFNFHLRFIGIYSIIILAQILCFCWIAKVANISQNAQIHVATSGMIFFGQWYLIDGVMNENAFQVLTYAFFFVYIVAFLYVPTRKYGSSYYAALSVMAVLLIISTVYAFFYIKRCYSDFMWIYYKKIGGSEKVKSKLFF
ncbi:hypothetical protein SLOPH_594 [Spraguea lophii 42_110]|uniref:Transmembrane protein n=1 Tax=Spraguea lophii (strain 42_110) TaxID=1358809 RepID=S7XV93_SPRLO|nr:hypothetical protein SLOPH_594 [Spraguea lophii 42_110]